MFRRIPIREEGESVKINLMKTLPLSWFCRWKPTRRIIFRGLKRSCSEAFCLGGQKVKIKFWSWHRRHFRDFISGSRDKDYFSIWPTLRTLLNWKREEVKVKFWTCQPLESWKVIITFTIFRLEADVKSIFPTAWDVSKFSYLKRKWRLNFKFATPTRLRTVITLWV